MYFIRRTTLPECAGIITNLQIVLNNPKKSLLKSSHLKQYLPNFPTLPPPPPPDHNTYHPQPRKRSFFPSLFHGCQITGLCSLKSTLRAPLTLRQNGKSAGRHRKQRDEIHLRVIWDCFSFCRFVFLVFFQAPCDCIVLL